MADDQMEIQITADTSQLESAMQQAGAACQKLGATAKKSMGEAQQATSAWQKAFTPLVNSFDSSITGMILGTTTWQKAVQRLAQVALQQFIDATVKSALGWNTYETTKTATTLAESGKRDAAEASSHQSAVGLILDTLARWLGLESAKTDASESGNATREVMDAVAAKLAVARAFGQIQVDAAVAAAGAMAAISAIPLVGPAAAPAIAAETYAETLGWATGLGAGLFSAAGGLWSVPADTLALVHKQESIIPASVAQPMRDFFTGGASGGASYAITIQAIDTQSGAQFLMNNAPLIAKSLAREMRNGNAALRKAV